ncbi:MAG TPA: carbonic anhydrase [Vicinamibacterales bacterium]|nr:carbonic anhydrase [Vicinamibacterales bacterium]
MSDSKVAMPQRRTILRAIVAGTAGAAAFDVAAPAALRAQSNLTPDAAVKELVAGNVRFAANQLTSIQKDLEVLKNRTAEKQEPFAAVLACADSRVPVEMIFDQTIGDVFVTRVAGNLVTPEIIASLEYAVAVLGVEVILVLGHTNCGAVKAAMTAGAVPGQISALYPPLRRAAEESGGDFAKAIAVNSRVQAELLRTSSTVIREAIAKAKVKVISGVYDLGSGKVTLT